MLFRYQSHGQKPFFSSPCVLQKLRSVIAADQGGVVYCFAASPTIPRSISLLWSVTLPGAPPVFASIAFSEKEALLIVPAVDGSVYALSAKDGGLAWSWHCSAPIYSSPAINDVTGLACFGSHDRNIYCLNTTDGTEWGKFNAGSQVYSAPSWLRFGGDPTPYVAACTTSGCIKLIRAGSDFTESVSVELPGEVFSSPVVASAALIVGCRDDYLYCFDIVTDWRGE